MRELARRTETSAANVSKLVAEMEADGLVTRERDPSDVRVLRAAATPLGAGALRDAWDAYLDRVATVFADMPEETRAEVGAPLDALLATLPER
jgi:DNA-binding MarR family transcriptional regulator